MTWNELADKIAALPDECKEQEVTVWLGRSGPDAIWWEVCDHPDNPGVFECYLMDMRPGHGGMFFDVSEVPSEALLCELFDGYERQWR